jgi:tetraacyldisaccharide 4'-kinase
MKAPKFWFNTPDAPGWQARLLAPVAAVWQAVTARRMARESGATVGVPVICIGNLTAGGTGKTPMVAALMERLAQRGITAHVVSRGYGGSIEGPHLVDPLEDIAAKVGDEPLLLAARGLVWVAKDRLAGARAAVEGGAKMILLDDGFQNPALRKDASILMIDADVGFGNGRVIPAGPLREPIAGGLARADVTVVVGDPMARAAALQRWPELSMINQVGAEMQAIRTGLPLKGENVVAFAGIGRPEKFFQTLRVEGANLIATHAFPDHHTYRSTIVRRLIGEARRAGAMLITTEKDAVRLPPSLRFEVMMLQVKLEPESWDKIDTVLSQVDTNKS